MITAAGPPPGVGAGIAAYRPLAAPGAEPDRQAGRCGEGAEHADTVPPGGAEAQRGRRGHDGAAGEVGNHVRGVEPAMYLGTERVDGTLVADVQRLGAEIEEDDPRYQGGQPMRAQGEQPPARQQDHDGAEG